MRRLLPMTLCCMFAPLVAQAGAERSGQARIQVPGPAGTSRLEQHDDDPRLSFDAAVSFASGRLRYRADPVPPGTETDGRLYRLQVATRPVSTHTVGVSCEALVSDDDLLAGIGFQGSRARSFELFPHVGTQMRLGRLMLPIRGGPFVRRTEDSIQTFAGDGDTTAIGVRFGIQPSLTLVQRRDFELTAFAGLDIGFGSVYDRTFFARRASGELTTLSAEAGVRMRLGHVLAGISYVHQDCDAKARDPVQDSRFPEREVRFDGLALTFGVSF